MAKQLWDQRHYAFESLGFLYTPVYKPRTAHWEAFSAASDGDLLSSLCVGRVIPNTAGDKRLRQVMLSEAVTWPIDALLVAIAIGEGNTERLGDNADDDDDDDAEGAENENDNDNDNDTGGSTDRGDPSTWQSTRARLVELRALYEDSMAVSQSHVRAVATLFQYLTCNTHLDSILLPDPYNLLVFPKTHILRAPLPDVVLRMARLDAVTMAAGEDGAPGIKFGVLIDEETADDMTLIETENEMTTCGTALAEYCGGDGGVFVKAAAAWAAETLATHPHLTFLPDTVEAVCANLAAEGTSATPLTLAVTTLALGIIGHDLTDVWPRVTLANNTSFLLCENI